MEKITIHIVGYLICFPSFGTRESMIFTGSNTILDNKIPTDGLSVNALSKIPPIVEVCLVPSKGYEYKYIKDFMLKSEDEAMFVIKKLYDAGFICRLAIVEEIHGINIRER